MVSLQRVADAALEKQIARQSQVFPPSIWMAIRRAFTPKGVPFFEFYGTLRRISLGQEPPDDLRQQFVRSANRLIQVKSPVDRRTLSPIVVNQIADSRGHLNALFNRLLMGRKDSQTWRQINEILVPLFIEIAKDKEIYLRSKQEGMERWATFRKMSPKQEYVERLRDDDPESYQLMKMKGKALEEIDEGIQSQIEKSGMILKKSFFMGRPVQVGEDPQSGEKRIYDRDGDILTFPEYRNKRLKQEEIRQSLSKVPTRTEVPLTDIRSMSDEEVDALPGNVEWAALTDDKAKAGRLTKVFATKRTAVPIKDADTGALIRTENVQVITSGRYKGIFLDDMINSQGRVIEGTSFSFSPMTGRESTTPQRIDPGQREPYVTVAEIDVVQMVGRQTIKSREQKLFLKIPGVHQYTELRNAIKKLACNAGAKRGCIPSVSYHNIEGSRAVGFYFDPKDFGVIKDTLKGMSLSKGALDMLKTYFKDVSRAEQATVRENLGFYSAEALGGFKAVRKNRETDEIRKFDLLTEQKKALAWMDARGNNGVCALDTGIGKCVKFDTLINTSSGLVPIEEMNPGATEPDQVLPVSNWSVIVNGEEKPVAAFYFGGKKPTLKVRTRRGYEIEGSLVHPILARMPNGEEWVKLPDLETGDFVCLDRSMSLFPEKEPELPTPVVSSSNYVEYDVPKEMNPDLARLLGYIVAEGWVNSRAGFSLSQEKKKNPTVRSDMEKLLFSQLKRKISSEEKDFFVGSVYLREFLKICGMQNGLAKDKEIPHTIMRSTKQSTAEFLKALIDCESYVTTGKIEYSTASEKLAKQVQVQLLRFGIVSSRTPKIVKGYDHIYWRVTITGVDVQKYMEEIGLISERKIKSVEGYKHQNPNLDTVPHTAILVDQLWKEIGKVSQQPLYKIAGVLKDKANHIRFGRRNSTFDNLRDLLDLATDFGIQESATFKQIAEVIEKHFFYDPIVSIETSESVVMDITVDDPSHCFIGNGLVNHNTLTAISMMQKLIRDGLAEEDATYETPEGKEIKTNGRFLFVCPNSLKGNLPKEIRNFISDPKDLLQRVDIISYLEFSSSSRSGKLPGSLKNVSFWKSESGTGKQANWRWAAKKWDPSLYVALIFDEASELASLTSKKFKAVNELFHPRKILLTASPIEKEPVDAYLLAAITNNVNLSDNSPEAKKNRVEMRRFMERFTERVGGRVVGVKQDPLVKRDLETWVKQNLFYADKTNVEEFELPELKAETTAVQMDPEVEKVYRSVTSTIPKIMKGLMSKFRDQGLTENGKVVPEARDPQIEKIFGMQFRPVLKLLNGLSNYPAETLQDVAFMLETETMPGEILKDGSPKPIPASLKKVLKEWKSAFNPNDLRKVADGLGNPKLEETTRTIWDNLSRAEGSSRSLIFSDDKKLCLMAGEHLSKKIPGWHAVALNDTIRIFSNGSEVPDVSFPIDRGEALKMVRGNESELSEILRKSGGKSNIPTPFRKKAYRKYPHLPAHELYNIHYKADRWQQFVLKEVISPNPRFKTCTLLGQSYMYGHNLQAFDTVIHLDRNTWNSENMKQRTARAWRQGQERPVNEITLDATYAEKGNNSDLDGTLDEIRRYFQQMESDLFDRIIKDAQSQALGLEWSEIAIKDASNVRLDREVLELMSSPFVSRSKIPGMVS